jgi:Ca2+-binding RTX toxin-like protein
VGEGTDTVWAATNYTLAAGSEVEFLRTNGPGARTLTGNEFDNTIFGGAANDTLIGGAGNDTLNGAAGNDTMIGGTGDDTCYVDNPGDVVIEQVGQGKDSVWAATDYTLAAGSEIEFLNGNGPVGHTFTGNEFNNTIIGNVGNDTLIAGIGNDTLVGGFGNDTLASGAGNDTMTGGSGNDIFKFLTGFGKDTIRDFTAHAGAASNKDLMDISALGITAATFNANVKIGGGGNALVTIGGGNLNTITLLNVNQNQISLADFRLAP